MFIRFITTGGTIDKIYFDTLSRFEVGESWIRRILSEALVTFDYGIEPLLQKDSLELSASDRAAIRRFVENDDGSRFDEPILSGAEAGPWPVSTARPSF